MFLHGLMSSRDSKIAFPKIKETFNLVSRVKYFSPPSEKYNRYLPSSNKSLGNLILNKF